MEAAKDNLEMKVVQVAVVVQVTKEAVLLVVKEEVQAAEASENSSVILQIEIVVVDHKMVSLSIIKKAIQKNSKQLEKHISRRLKQ